MTRYLVRHGVAAPGPDDRARPLTAAGREAVLAVAHELAARRAEVAEIRHSGLTRARETAELLASVLNPVGGVHETDGLGPEDDPDVARAELEEATRPLMLVGHLPHLGRLAEALLGAAAVRTLRLDPATVLGVTPEGRGWRLALVLAPPGARPSRPA